MLSPLKFLQDPIIPWRLGEWDVVSIWAEPRRQIEVAAREAEIIHQFGVTRIITVTVGKLGLDRLQFVA